MAYLLNLKNGSNKVLGGLIFLCSITILVFQTTFIENFSLQNFEDILSLLSISSVLTLILYYIGIKEFLVSIIARTADSIWSMPKEINFRTIQKSIHLQEANNSLIGILLTFFACSMLLIVNLIPSSGIYRILFEGGQSNNGQIDPLLGNFPFVGFLLILISLLVLLGIRLFLDFQNARKKYGILWIYFILEMNPPPEGYHNQISKNLDGAAWELANQKINEFIQKTYEDSCSCLSRQKKIKNMLDIFESGKFESLINYQYTEESNPFDEFLREFENSLGHASGDITRLSKIGLQYLLAKRYSGPDLGLMFDNLRELSTVLLNLKEGLDKARNYYNAKRLLHYWIENLSAIKGEYLKHTNLTAKKQFLNYLQGFYGKFEFILFQELVFKGDNFLEEKDFFKKIKSLFNEYDKKNSNVISSIEEKFQESGGSISKEIFEKFVSEIRKIDPSKDENYDLDKLARLFLSNTDLRDRNSMFTQIDFSLFSNLKNRINQLNATLKRINDFQSISLIIERFEFLFSKEILLTQQLQLYLTNKMGDLKPLLRKQEGLKEIRAEIYSRFEKVPLSDNMISRYLQ